MYKNCLVKNIHTGEVFNGGELDLALNGVGGYPLREAAAEVFEIEAKKQQFQANPDALALLAETDWQVIRHRDQLAMGSETSLPQSEYENL